MFKNLSHMEFSKKLLIFSWAVAIVLTVTTVIFSLVGLSLDGVIVVTPLSWVEVGAATGFYYWKAKNENRAKYAQAFLKKFTKKWDAETAIRMAEIVLKD